MRVLLYLFTFFMSMAFFSSHTMAATITVDEQKMAIQAKELQQKPLLTQAIQLQGPSSSRDFYYTLKEDVQTDGHTVTFQIQHSTLLIAPSSFTVKVDDAAVKTVALTPDLLKQTVTVTLPKKALLKGTHKISTDFYGVIKEGVCVAPGNTGSWLSIDILSSISTFYGNAEALTLNDYPSAFLSYENRIVTLVLPDKASEATRNSSYQLAAYLSEQGDKNVDIKRESAMAQVTGPVIVVGAKGEFSTKHMQEILKNAKVQYEDALSLAIHQLRNTEGEQSIPALFVTAASAEAIEERISLLTDERLSKQLAGSVLTIDALPKVEKRSTTTIPLKQMGFENRTLSSQVPATPHYYVNLPQFEADKEATMRLVLKKSATLPKKDDDKDREVELVLHVNNVPHAVDLRELEQTSSDVYEVTIPIQTNVLNSQSMTDLQFEVTGFQLEDPCETTNEKYWLYIDDSSTLSMTKEAVNPTFTLRDFPNAFYDRSVIVEADGVNSDDTQMLYLYKTLMANGQTANTTIRKEKNVKENELKKSAVIFVGTAKDFTLLAKNKDKIPQSAEDYIQQGFLPETIAQYAFIAKSSWQEKQPMMLLQTMDQAFTQEEFLAYLTGANEKTTAAIETKDGGFTIASGDTDSSNEEETEESSSVSWVLIAQFTLLVLVIGLVLYFFLRKKRKNNIVEQDE